MQVLVTYIEFYSGLLSEYTTKYNLSEGKISIMCSFNDPDSNNYYEEFGLMIFSNGLYFENSTYVFDSLNSSAYNIAASYSLVKLISSSYDLDKNDYRRVLKSPLQMLFNLKSKTVSFTGQGTLSICKTNF